MSKIYSVPSFLLKGSDFTSQNRINGFISSVTNDLNKNNTDGINKILDSEADEDNVGFQIASKLRSLPESPLTVQTIHNEVNNGLSDLMPGLYNAVQLSALDIDRNTNRLLNTVLNSNNTTQKSKKISTGTPALDSILNTSDSFYTPVVNSTNKNTQTDVLNSTIDSGSIFYTPVVNSTDKNTQTDVLDSTIDSGNVFYIPVVNSTDKNTQSDVLNDLIGSGLSVYDSDIDNTTNDDCSDQDNNNNTNNNTGNNLEINNFDSIIDLIMSLITSILNYAGNSIIDTEENIEEDEDSSCSVAVATASVNTNSGFGIDSIFNLFKSLLPINSEENDNELVNNNNDNCNYNHLFMNI